MITRGMFDWFVLKYLLFIKKAKKITKKVTLYVFYVTISLY